MKSLGASPEQVVSLVRPRQARQEALGQAALTTGAAASPVTGLFVFITGTVPLVMML